MEPERMHCFPGIADSPEGIDTGIGICIMIVLPQVYTKEVPGESIAFRCGVAIMQVDRDLISSEAGGVDRQFISEADERRIAITASNRRRRVSSIETPDVGWLEIGVKAMG